MPPDPRPGAAVREVRLEGASLAAALVALAALLLGAFEMGRVIERAHAPGRPAGAGADPATATDAETQEAPEKKVTFFDTTAGGGKEAEPKRQAAGSKPGGPAPVEAPPPIAPTPGSWFVQVFVGRDRAAAEEVVRTVRQKGYPVRVDAVPEGASGSLFKVRVGGYESKDAADAAARRLESDGEKSTWVVRLGG
ncbi:MAG TPA: SPOR domain-containing protein [Candidatus Sulfotelmatobacter sp.]|jgi:cell division septation protein DedD|nr:SPOR domain-containing protein [Candidatus Sulfotelmatobacter sp.]